MAVPALIDGLAPPKAISFADPSANSCKTFRASGVPISSGTITLSRGELVIAKDLSIAGLVTDEK
jgi:hypothetical protein